VRKLLVGTSNLLLRIQNDVLCGMSHLVADCYICLNTYAPPYF